MFRAAVRTAPRILRHANGAAGRRFASTAPADKKYTWKGSAARWALAGGALYWYNTSPIFADEAPSRYSTEPPQFSENDLPTVDAVVEGKRRELDARIKAKGQDQTAAAKASTQPTPPESTGDIANTTTAAVALGEVERTPEQLEEEAGQQGAFNPETGEINWDCPCLGGMAHGPCGEEFKAAFSCFVYSNEEPKGMDCVDKFQHMQDCFRQYPDVYGAELAEEDAAEAEAAADAEAAALIDARDAKPSDTFPAPSSAPKDDTASKATETPTPVASDEGAKKSAKKQETSKPAAEEHKPAPATVSKDSKPPAPTTSSETSNEGESQPKNEADDESERGLPKRSFDATAANTKSEGS